jgi:hypothetical protein
MVDVYDVRNPSIDIMTKHSVHSLYARVDGAGVLPFRVIQCPALYATTSL